MLGTRPSQRRPLRRKPGPLAERETPRGQKHIGYEEPDVAAAHRTVCVNRASDRLPRDVLPLPDV